MPKYVKYIMIKMEIHSLSDFDNLPSKTGKMFKSTFSICFVQCYFEQFNSMNFKIPH